MKCKKCGDEHDGTYGSGLFCSKKCVSSYAQSHVKKENQIKSWAKNDKVQKAANDLIERQKQKSIDLKNKNASLVYKCENCNCDKVGKYGSGRFCSEKCARCFSTKEKREEINKVVSEKAKGRSNPIKNLKDRTEKFKKTVEDKFLNINFDDLKFESLRKRVLLEQNHKCNNPKCRRSKWLGEKLTLELEHIDGNRLNNKRENLEALCPNCHSLTKTWRGRNKKNRRPKNTKIISDENLLKLLIKHNYNIRQALIEAGIAAKGANYSRCHKLIRMSKD